MQKLSTEFCKLLTSNQLEKAKIVFNTLDTPTKKLYILVASKIIKNTDLFSERTTQTAYKILKLLDKVVEIHHTDNKFTFKTRTQTFKNVNTNLQLNTLDVLKPLAESLGITGLSKMNKSELISSLLLKIIFNPPLKPSQKQQDTYSEFNKLKKDPDWNQSLKKYINSLPIINRLYKCDSQIGSGTHSVVFNGKSILKTPVAFKIEIQRGSGQLNLLRYEQEIIRNFKKSDDRLVQILDVFWNINYFSPTHPDWKINITISPLYTRSLQNALPGLTQQKLHWAREAIMCIKQAHNIPMRGGVLHRDIKPDNFCIQKDGKLVLIDFGLSEWADNTIQKALKNKRETVIVGSRPFNSYWSELLIPQGYRDDTQSVGFMIWRILHGPLPWEKVANPALKLDADTLSPEPLKQYFKHCKKLEIQQKPDYDFLISLFT